jgi:hypothetical protein
MPIVKRIYKCRYNNSIKIHKYSRKRVFKFMPSMTKQLCCKCCPTAERRYTVLCKVVLSKATTYVPIVFLRWIGPPSSKIFPFGSEARARTRARARERESEGERERERERETVTDGK